MTHSLTAKEAFPRDAMERIAKVIEQVESNTSAEIRVSIREERDAAEAAMTMEEITLREFALLGMEKTANRTGILLLVLYDEHKFYIYGDAGINAVSDPTTWVDVAAVIQENFRRGQFETGVIEGLKAIIPHVHKVLPRQENDVDELSNEPVIR